MSWRERFSDGKNANWMVSYRYILKRPKCVPLGALRPFFTHKRKIACRIHLGPLRTLFSVGPLPRPPHHKVEGLGSPRNTNLRVRASQVLRCMLLLLRIMSLPPPVAFPRGIRVLVSASASQRGARPPRPSARVPRPVRRCPLVCVCVCVCVRKGGAHSRGDCDTHRHPTQHHTNIATPYNIITTPHKPHPIPSRLRQTRPSHTTPHHLTHPIQLVSKPSGIEW